MLAMVDGDEEEDRRIATDSIGLCSVRRTLLSSYIIMIYPIVTALQGYKS